MIFPAILSWKAGKAAMNRILWNEASDLPALSLIISAYNEEKVIQEKLLSFKALHYPADKLELLVGSDGSTDRTNEIVLQEASKDSRIRLIPFTSRRGKPSVVNDLVRESQHAYILFTDSNVFFDVDCLVKLMRHFKNPQLGLIGANILNVGMKKSGISVQEKSYIERENRIKYHEGILWGTMMGPFGGCYAMRKNLFEPVPANFLVDDFFICMKVLEKGYRCMNDLEAICYEDVSDDVFQEYRRKARISAGNFQNLSLFSSFLLKPFSPLGFSFLSHKVLRWLSPFLILLSWLSLIPLCGISRFYTGIFWIETLLISSPLLDWLFRRAGIHLFVLRFVSYFVLMNLALLNGFFRYIGGVSSSVWIPTKRG